MAVLHRSLMTAFVLLHMFNNERQERVEMASRGTRVVTHASTTTVNRSHKLWQMPNKAAKTPAGIYLLRLEAYVYP